MNKFIKRSLPILITIALAWFVFRRGIHWGDLRSVLIQARWGWLLLALAAEAGAYGAVTWLNEILLQRYGLKVPYGKQFIVQLVMAFIEVALPSASISGLVLRARLLKPHGVSPDVATASTMAETVLITLSVLLFVLPVAAFAMLNGLAGFSGADRLLWFLAGSTLFLGITMWQWKSTPLVNFRTQSLHSASRIWKGYFQMRWPRQLEDWPAERIIQRVRYLWVETVASLIARPHQIFLSLMARTAFEALCLMMCFLALGQKLPVANLLLLYLLTIAINTLGGIPGGVGLAEVSLSAIYTQFGVATETAVVIALAYRLTGYWFPRVIGGLAWIWLERGDPNRHILEKI
ncbi:MAG: lysylphosphatidylglycerol synthase transmembrane domain-containing protein [Chloroflexi bacterium]|nr:lysylphosphatidylglycerol synthase transmembrane domain-containing protein [Chloroflexota bacterium]